MKSPVRSWSLPLVLLALLLAAVPAAAATDDAAAAEGPLFHDALHYAKTYDVGLEQALERLRLQPLAGKLQAELAAREPASFAGMWIRHEPSWLIVVQFTEGGGAGLQSLLQGDDYFALYPHVDVYTAARSLQELAAIQTAAHGVARAQRLPAESSINVPENRVDLYTTEPDFVAAALAAEDARRALAGAPALLADVAVVGVERLSSPARYLSAGRPMSTCTSGFAVQSAGGVRGVLTSGHCPNTQSFNLRSLPFQSELFSGSHDVQWHNSGGELHAVNRTWDGQFDTTTPNYRFITATKPRAQQVIGEQVCKFGMTTGFTCGTISSTTLAPSYVPSAAATFIVVSSTTQDQSAPGDSGGPWFSGSTAYGVNSGEFTANFNAIYMAIDFAAGLGVTVLTTTPTLNLGRFTYRNMGDIVQAFTEINHNDYECGVAGFATRDADFNENGAGDIIQAWLAKANQHFTFVADLKTHLNHESWDFDLLCLKKSVYNVTRFEWKNLGENISFNTGLSTATYECGIGGSAARDGDPQEAGSGNPYLTYMFRSGGTWWARADFRTHNNHESWDIDALCVNKSHPVIRFEFKNIGDAVANFNTGVSTATYECGVAGYAALDADINEAGSGDFVQVFLFQQSGTWRIGADLRTHNNQESWDVDLLCIQR